MTRRGATYAIVVAALVCLAISGAVHPYVAPLCLGWLAIQRFFLDRVRVRVPEGAVALLHIWLGTIFLWYALLGRRGTDTDLLELLLGFGAPFLILKVVSPQTRFNDAVTVMGCIILALGSAATAPGLAPVVNLSIFLVTCCLALPSLIRREPTGDDGVALRVLDRPGAWRFAPIVAGLMLACIGLLLGAVLYLFVPRLAPDGESHMEQQALDIQARRARKRHTSGFARTMKIGDIGSIKRDDRIAFEAQCRNEGRPYDVPRPLAPMLLMRMRAWDTYTAGTGEWTRQLGKLMPIGRDGVLRRDETARMWPIDWTIRAVGYGGRTLLLPQHAGRVKSPGIRLLRGPSGAVIAEEPIPEYGIEAGLPVTSRADFGRLVAGESSPALLQVPAEIAAALRERLPRRPGMRIVDRVTAIQRYFTQSNFRYTLHLPPSLPKDIDPLLAFLDRREGHCELYAAAACLMLRLYGVPARVAGGMRMTPNEDVPGKGRYRARFRNAHAWVEILCRDEGWVAVDFTPPDRRAVAPTPGAGGGGDEDTATLDIGGRGDPTAETPPLLDWSDPFTFTRADQARLRSRVWQTFDGRSLPWLGGALLGWTLFVLFRSSWRRRRVSPLRISAPDGVGRRTLAFYARWLKQCAAKGHLRKRSQTPREFLAGLPEELLRDGREVTARFEALRYQ